MATYLELQGIFSDSSLLAKAQVAVVISAYNLVSSGTPTAAQKAWATDVFSSPGLEAKKALMAVLAENNTMTIATIQGATDSALQTQIDAVVQILVDAKAGV
jgi:hypothetical protein